MRLHGALRKIRHEDAKARHSFARHRFNSGVPDMALFWDAVSVGHPQRAETPVPSLKSIREILAPHGMLVERRLYHAGHEFATEVELAGFTAVACHGKSGNDVASKLAVDAMHFAWHRTCMRQPAVVGLVSKSASHAYLLHRVQDLGVKTLVLHPEQQVAALPKSLVGAADAVLSWSSNMVDDSGDRGPEQDCKASLKTLVCQADPADLQQRDGKLKEWRALEPEEKLAAQTLGYDRVAWDEGRTPSRCRLPWVRMAEEDRSAAIQLGYSPAEWDMEVSMLDSLGLQPSAVLSAQALEQPHSREFEHLTHHSGVGSMHGGGQSPLGFGIGFSSGFEDAFSDDIELGLVVPHRRSSQ